MQSCRPCERIVAAAIAPAVIDGGMAAGLIAWVLAIIGLSRGMRAVSRSRLLGVNDGV